MFKKIAFKLGLSWLGRFARSVAEGDRGPTAKRWYMALIGRKRLIGLTLGALSAVLLALGQVGAVAFISGTLSAAFLSIGLIDKSWRDSPPPDSRVLRFLRDHALDVSAVLAAGSAAFVDCASILSANLPFGMTCEHGAMFFVALAALAVHLGISVEAKIARPPKLNK